MGIRRWTAIALLLLVPACAASHKVYRAGEQPDETGVWYTLPKNSFRVSSEITRTEYTRTTAQKSFWDELQKDMPLFEKVFPKPPTIGAPRFEMGKPSLTRLAVPDAQQTFFVDLESSPFIDRSLEMGLSPEGFLVSGKSEVTNKTVDFVVESAKAAGSIAGAMVAGGAADPNKVKAIAADIETIRGHRLEVISGLNARGLSEAAIGRLLKELGKQEERLLSWFRTKSVKKWTLVADYEPTGVGPVAMFGFAKDKGVEDYGLIVGSIPADFRAPSAATQVDLAVLRSAHGQLADVATEVTEKGPHGFYYRVPLAVDVVLTTGSRELLRRRSQVAQLGTVSALPRRTWSRGALASVTLDPQTGMLTKVGATSKAFDAALVGQAGGAAAALIAARGKASEEEDEQLAKALRAQALFKARWEARDYRNKIDEDINKGQ